MSNFIVLSNTYQTRIEELSEQLSRIETHVRRKERRAAAARLKVFYKDIESVLNELSFPLDFMFTGANLGLFSGAGPWLRGRLPASVLGVLAGWIVGQAAVSRQRHSADAMRARAHKLERSLRHLGAAR